MLKKILMFKKKIGAWGNLGVLIIFTNNEVLKVDKRGNKKVLYLASVGFLVCFALIGDVGAQESYGSGASDINLEIEKPDSQYVGDKIAWVNEQMVKAKGIYRRVQNMLDRARQEKDSVKIDCLDDKLTQIHVNIRGIEERKGALEISINAGDNATAEQQFTILKIYIARINGLMGEAEGCLGDTDVVIGESETVVTIDEHITVEDPSETADVFEGTEQPPHASGYF